MSPRQVDVLFRYITAVVSVALAIGVRRLLDPVIGQQFTFATVFLAVLVIARYGGFRPALLAVFTGAVASKFFLMPPRWSFELTSADQQIGLLLYIIKGLGIAWLAGSMHAAERALRHANDQLESRVRERTGELEQTNNRLKASEERFRLIVEGVSSHAIFQLDSAGNILTWNPGAERIKGYKPEEIIGQHFSRFYSPEEIAIGKPQRELEIAVAEGFYEEECLRIRKDGTKFWAVVTITAIFAIGRQLVGFIKVTRDIVKRKAMEFALEDAVRFNRATLDGLSAHISILEEDGTIVAVNEAWKRFGVGNNLASGRGAVSENYLKVCDQTAVGQPASEGKQVAAGIREVLSGRIPSFEAEYPCHSPTEKQWFVVRVTPFPDEEQRRVIVAHENISERKSIESAFRAERDRFEKIVSAVPVVICAYLERPDGTTCFPFANPAIVSIYGCRPEDLAEDAAPIFSRMHPDDAGWVRSTLDESARTLTAWRGEYRVQNPKRGEIWVEGHMIPSAEPDGGILWLGYIVYITERKRSAAVSHDRERMLGIVTETARVGLVVVGKDYRYRYANRAYTDIFELDAGKIVGSHVWEVLPAGWSHVQFELDAGRIVGSRASELSPEGWSQIQSRMDRALAGESVEYEMELPARSASEGPRYYSIVYQPGADEKGEATVVVVVVDISVPKRAEEAVRKSEARFRGAFEHTNVAMVITDIENRFLETNAAFAQLFGYTEEEVLQSSLGSLTHPDHMAESLANRQVLLSGESDHFEMEKRYLRKDGHVIWGLTNVSLLRDQHGQPFQYVGQVQDITERKRVVAALRESEQRLRIFIEHAPAALAMFDEQMRYLAVSRRWMSDYGLPEGDLVGRSHYDVFPKIPASWRDVHSRALAGEVVHANEDRFVRADQSAIWLQWEVRPWYRAEGTIGGIVFFTENITERKRAEEELAERARLSALSADVGLALTTGDTFRNTLQRCVVALVRNLGAEFARIWTLNEAENVLELQVSAGKYTHIDGSHSRVPVGKFKIGLIAQERKPHLSNDVLNDPRIGDHEWVQKEGMVAFAGYPLLAGERLVGVVALFSRHQLNSVTTETLASVANQIALGFQRNRADEGRNLFRALLDRSNDAIEVIDLDTGRFLDANETAYRSLGYTREEYLTLGVTDTNPDLAESGWAAFSVELRRTGAIVFDTHHRRKDGSKFPVEVNSKLIRLDREYSVAVVRDITEKKKLEAQFQQSQKMEAFGQLAGGVAHDFNNLLTVISGYSDLLLMKLPTADKNRDLVDQIRHAGDRAASLTRQLLAFSRQQVLEPRVLDLNAIIADTEKMLRRLIGEDIRFTTVLNPNLNLVKVDPGQLEQVIMNLVVNARDAMPQGGKITIETSNVELDETYAASHSEVRPGRFVCLSVSDTGSGMTPEVIARIFEPFFTTKGVGKGTGLGLAVVLGIVKQSHGSVEIYSELGIGTTFKIYLPAVYEQPATWSDSVLAPSPRGRETIVLAEDEDGVRKFASIVLEGFGYTVLEAVDGSTALEIMESHGEKIDLLVTDVVMPKISGRQLAETVQAKYPGLKVLFLSGYTDDAVVRHGVLQANVAFLQKPFTPNSLARKVREELDRQ